MKFDDWFYEMEGYGFRAERFWDDFERQDRVAMIEWLKTAYQMGSEEAKMNFTPEQYKLIYTAVRRYQCEKTALNSKEYSNCSEVLDELFDSVYTQQREQPT